MEQKVIGYNTKGIGTMWYKKTTACSTGVRSQSIKIPQITVQNKQNRRPVTAKKVFFIKLVTGCSTHCPPWRLRRESPATGTLKTRLREYRTLRPVSAKK